MADLPVMSERKRRTILLLCRRGRFREKRQDVLTSQSVSTRVLVTKSPIMGTSSTDVLAAICRLASPTRWTSRLAIFRCRRLRQRHSDFQAGLTMLSIRFLQPNSASDRLSMVSRPQYAISSIGITGVKPLGHQRQHRRASTLSLCMTIIVVVVAPPGQGLGPQILTSYNRRVVVQYQDQPHSFPLPLTAKERGRIIDPLTFPSGTFVASNYCRGPGFNLQVGALRPLPNAARFR
ncbi:uncharacterized protein ARMOST_18482 [Armillaria ostoyae]|uniref:Uncharacterized protein n=1 Tax=Armillaria ostoyae TaxID=47428 RepID=A0A284S1V8_ARMOS|nr:uncharacterized protein ARMOST_18482 [Armillaria ostoyae]